jgi:hypothetical protein
MKEKDQAQNGNSKQKKSSVTDGLSDIFGSSNIVNNAQKVITSAINVLEEEIAAGILAAKKIEKKIIDVDELRHNPEDLMNRIRRDTHEALDIFLDAFASLSKQIGILSDSVSSKSENGNTTVSEERKTGTPQIIEYEKPVKPGQKINFRLSLFDDAMTKPVKLDFQKMDFTASGNQRILSKFIQVKPTNIILNPGEKSEIDIEVSIPKISKPGYYHSVFFINSMPQERSILSFQVK